MGAFGPLTFSHPSGNELAVDSCSFKDGEVTHCLFCPEEFKLPDERTYFSSHLFVCHQFEIKDIETIASVSR
jgi:hypothetical protein